MRSVEDEAKLCLPSFTRLCVAHVVETGVGLDEAAVEVARRTHGRIPIQTPGGLTKHIEDALSLLVDLVSALSPRLPAHILQEFSQKTSQIQVCETLQRSMEHALRKRLPPSEPV